jgi:hypothetical protein
MLASMVFTTGLVLEHPGCYHEGCLDPCRETLDLFIGKLKLLCFIIPTNIIFPLALY